MPCAHQPRLEIYITAIVEVGITPFGIFVVGETVLKDAHHVFRVQNVGCLKVSRSAYCVTYPIPLAATVKKLHIDKSCQLITTILVLLYNFIQLRFHICKFDF